MRLSAHQYLFSRAQQTAGRCISRPRSRAPDNLVSLCTVSVFQEPLTMVSDPSQSQGLLSSSTARGFREDEGLQAVHNNAWDAPQVHDPASEGLQSADYDGRDGPQALAPPPLAPDTAYAHHGDNNPEKAGITISADDAAPSRQSSGRRWMWPIIIAVVLVIAIAVGVGAGVGLSRKSNDSDKSVGDAANTSAGSVVFNMGTQLAKYTNRGTELDLPRLHPRPQTLLAHP
jgi:hypothetical protein